MRALKADTLLKALDALVLAEPRVDVEVSVPLGARELQLLADMPWPHRRKEWLAGRKVSKVLLAQSHGLAAGRIEILPAPSGAPLVYLDGVQIPDLVLNISHTRSWVVAAVAAGRVGIDVCDDADGRRIDRIASRVFSEGEVEACDALRDDCTKASVWAMKEAGLKLRIGGVFSPGARSIRVMSLDPPRVADGSMRMELLRLPDAVVALAQDVEAAASANASSE
jgi:phosphopantetheinyl transferase